MILALLFLLAPDLSGVLRLTNGTSLAHACPISMDRALTNRHVVSGASEWVWGIDDGERYHGLVDFAASDEFRDLAVVKPITVMRFPRWYTISKTAPAIGERIYFIGYDWRSHKEAFAPKVFDAKVTRLVNGQLIFDSPGKPGSSGSCILNEAGEVVAINQGAKDTENSSLAGLGVGVWGSWLRLKRDEPEEVVPYHAPYPWRFWRVR
jgi:S1-C subfamily serine protease